MLKFLALATLAFGKGAYYEYAEDPAAQNFGYEYVDDPTAEPTDPYAYPDLNTETVHETKHQDYSQPRAPTPTYNEQYREPSI
jgi:hypothetical protein